MEKSLSFTGVEKQYLHEFRNRVNLSEDIVDLENIFRQMIHKILQSESLIRIGINERDFSFDPQDNMGYRLADRLLGHNEFRQIYENSDLKHVIGRFAQPISKRYLHLKNNPKRSDTKIRQQS